MLCYVHLQTIQKSESSSPRVSTRATAARVLPSPFPKRPAVVVTPFGLKLCTEYRYGNPANYLWPVPVACVFINSLIMPLFEWIIVVVHGVGTRRSEVG